MAIKVLIIKIRDTRNIWVDDPENLATPHLLDPPGTHPILARFA